MSSHGAPIKTPLRQPAFRRLWLALAASRLGDEFTVLALVWFILQLTGSGTAIGMVFLCFQLPTIVTSPLIGRLLDRYQPRWVMSLDNFVRAFIMLGFPILHWLDTLQLWQIYAMALLAGALSPATEAGIPATIPRLVPMDELEQANASLSMVWELATLIGPGLGGVLIDHFGAAAVVLIDAATFLIMGFVTCSLPRIQIEPARSDSNKGCSWFGFRALFRLKVLRVLTIFEIFLLFIQGFQAVVLSVYSQAVLGAGVTGYGLLLSAFGIGSVLGLLLVHQPFAQHQQPGITLAVILGLFGVPIFPLVFLRSFLAVTLFLLAAGILAAPFFPIAQAAVQRLVPADSRGEFFGARGSLGICGYPLGGAVGGVLLDLFAAPVIIGLSALTCVVMGGVGIFSAPLRGLKRDASVVASSR